MDTDRYLELFLDGAREQEEVIRRSIAQLGTGDTAEALTALRRGWHTMKGMAATMGFHGLAELCHAAETLLENPSERLPQLETAYRALCGTLAGLDAGDEEPIDLRVIVDGLRGKPSTAEPDASRGEPPSPLPLPSRVRVATEDLDLLLAEAAEMDAVVRSLRASDASDGSDARRPQMDRMQRGLGRVRLRLSRMRLLPFSLLLPSLEKTVSWAARQRRGVEVRLHVEGADTRVDRATLGVLVEPLIHLLRNAVAHGAGEPGGQRTLAAPLEVHLRVAVENRSLQVVLEDNGCGIDVDALSRKLEPADAAALRARAPRDDLADLLARAGVSAWDRTTALAGRGIGLDAVRHAVSRAGGNFRFFQREAGGVRVELTLPQSISVTPCLLARCGTTTYGFPLTAIAGTDQCRITALERLDDGLWSWPRGDGALAAAPLEALLDPRTTWHAPHSVALVRLESPAARGLGVLVDTLMGRIDAAVRPLPGPLADGPYVGTALCGDGTPVAVIDPGRLHFPNVPTVPRTP